MKFRKSNWLSGFLLLAVTLSACNLGATPAPTQDIVAIQSTAMAQVISTVSAQQTQTAAAIPPTAIPTDTLLPTFTLQPTFAPAGGSTPFVFDTPLPGLTPLAIASPTLGAISTVTTKNGCNDGTYIGETAPYDNTEFGIGEIIKKGWTILNSGTCEWDEGYAFAFMPDSSSPEVSGPTITLPKNKPSDYTKPGHTQSFIVTFKAPKVAGTYKVYWKLRDDSGNYFGPLVYLIFRVRKP